MVRIARGSILLSSFVMGLLAVSFVPIDDADAQRRFRPEFQKTLEELRVEFDLIDTNGNELLNRREARDAADRRFQSLDVDGSQALDRSEFLRYVRSLTQYNYTDFQGMLIASQYIEAYDTDFSGDVELGEYRDRVVGAVLKWDRDDNQNVSFEEFLLQLRPDHARCYCPDY